MEVLIINIDRGHRSLYTGAVVAGLIAKIPMLRVTGLLSNEAEALGTTGQFLATHFVDTDEFFIRTKDLPNEGIEAELWRVLGGLEGVEWDVVINLSSNLLGALLGSYVAGKQLKGNFIDAAAATVQPSDVASHMLAAMPDSESNYFHFSYLYGAILKRHERLVLASIWPRGQERSLRAHMKGVKSANGGRPFVLLDGRMEIYGGEGSQAFVGSLYAALAAGQEATPVVLVDDVEASDPLVTRLRQDLPGELNVVKADRCALLSLVGQMAAVVTDDLLLKAAADVAGCPSLLLTARVDTSDYSTLAGSFQMVAGGNRGKFVDNAVTVLHALLSGGGVPALAASETYETIYVGDLPLLAAAGPAAPPDYMRWLLGTRLLMTLSGISLPPLVADRNAYRGFVQREQGLMRGQGKEGLWAQVSGLSHVPGASSWVTNGQPLRNAVSDFFVREMS